MTRLMWKQGRPSTTAWAYSAIFRFRLVTVSSQFTRMASRGQTAMHRPQPTHLLWSMVALRSVTVTPLWAQIRVQAPQPTHLSAGPGP